MSAPLALYKYDSCPFCRMVIDVVARLDARVEMRDVLEDPARLRELVEATGRRTVPCLRIEESSGEVRWMHESVDIIRFLEARAAAA